MKANSVGYGNIPVAFDGAYDIWLRVDRLAHRGDCGPYITYTDGVDAVEGGRDGGYGAR